MRVLIQALLAVLALLAVPAAAQDVPHIRYRLVPETATPAAGGTVRLALVATPQPGWHGYWKNGGDAGLETQVGWRLPGGVTAGPLVYPVPQRLLIAGLMNYVYEKPFVQFVDLTVPRGLAAGTRLPVSVKIDYLVCTTEMCVPESQTLATTLTVGDGSIAPATRARFDQWRQALPKPLGSPATYQLVKGRFRLAIPFPANAPIGDAYFYPLRAGAIGFVDHRCARRSLEPHGGRGVFVLPCRSDANGGDGL